MRQYITRRLLEMIPVIIGISFLLFVIFAMAPGDAVDNIANPNISQEKLMDLKKQYGLVGNPVERYFNWAKKAVQFDFGDSIKHKEKVSTVIDTYVWNSFWLSLGSFFLSTLIAIPIGVVSATKQYSVFDKFFTIFALFGVSIPSFFFGMVLIKIFAVDLAIFPVSGMISTGVNATGIAHVLDVMKHMALPLIVLTLISLAGLMRYTRTAMLEVIRQDYIRTARSKGLSEKVVIYKHALRNAMIPIITILAMQLPGLFGGAILTEQVFAWPGIGRVAIEAINGRDYPLLMGFEVLLAILTLLGNLIADVTYALVDPRIRLK
ncbi:MULTISPECIES: ABC transporter permease [Clostridium]|uniref:ABC transporter permease n=1 Tax=Clostridium cadaveris TaxID=1529 RepID=A0A1I2LB78_9CLOT|nr:ABC transporter permease [Clostridium cadaveris]MDU4951673.1 ABC transporter permease [Clostridium sp.]MDM8312614.1 ABC transporter permease [Clostridium cadaveris]MDY4948436.1 ABC transporter permease [Clostridium cadaveris]NME64685.1 ABC transporter permease [Clostridium cadaveris]NWK09617.1 ABC transporter permease [Clostridium cadaveris]